MVHPELVQLSLSKSCPHRSEHNPNWVIITSPPSLDQWGGGRLNRGSGSQTTCGSTKCKSVQMSLKLGFKHFSCGGCFRTFQSTGGRTENALEPGFFLALWIMKRPACCERRVWGGKHTVSLTQWDWKGLCCVVFIECSKTWKLHLSSTEANAIWLISE